VACVLAALVVGQAHVVDVASLALHFVDSGLVLGASDLGDVGLAAVALLQGADVLRVELVPVLVLVCKSSTACQLLSFVKQIIREVNATFNANADGSHPHSH
jgi:hypothetical protein